MPELVLPGCGTTPLSDYLTGLGVLRSVTRLFDRDATGSWRGQRFVLDSTFTTLDELVEALHERFEPEAIVSPWNAGSGFAGNGKNVTAEKALEWVRRSADERLVTLRSGVEAGDEVVRQGRELGWGGTGSELWQPDRKRDVLMLCRNSFPDEALAWLDAANVLTGDGDVAINRLLGTGGNFGRQDLSATYISRVRSAFTDDRSKDWLHALLSGHENVSYLRSTVGQFDPGRAGGVQSSPLEKADSEGFANPWGFLLTVEGALLFAAAVVRRHGAGYSDASVPFQVRGATSGHATAAPDERALGELWTPEWFVPARLDEIVQLLSEGRAEWRDRPARSGLDFARAVASLGVDRGIAAFERYVFVDRLGQNPLAVPADRIPVRRRESVRLLSELDRWLNPLRERATGTVSARVRDVDEALFAHARTGEQADFVAVLAAIGRAHEAVAVSGTARRIVPPLVLGGGWAIASELFSVAQEDPELRIALALATARDDQPEGERRLPTLHGLRPLLSPVTRHDYFPAWTDRPTPCPLRAGLCRALTTAVRRRGMPRPDDEGHEEMLPAVRGPRITFRHGMRIGAGDMQALLDGVLDERRIAELLAGLLTVDWATVAVESREKPPWNLHGPRAHDVSLDLLVPFGIAEPFTLPREDDSEHRILLRPGAHWPAMLAANRAGEVLDDAARRLRLGGVPHVVRPRHHVTRSEALAVALLARARDSDVQYALRRVGVLPDITEADKESA
ncbi:type I-U CRISPR-associated protein Csx17 [Haloechinothrix sp. LS1_15]|uniref:type I-G CRISPR-associated protein Cas8g1/Csx17 n=1 Tax=Haloechinothrix sp. LS1_15 TaxID=2652248 RepID=UPI00294524FB|nr:type I-U CRISPR-associated protein Csx17 [Haloechinothrix sp. LS1_15]MDV6011656.1 type I-U CRISPR-associated protein Csx17 [Haloechinothrix sp. LS1_15]